MRLPRQLAVREMMPPGHYRDVVVVLMTCSFSASSATTDGNLAAKSHFVLFRLVTRSSTTAVCYRFVGDEIKRCLRTS
jgi:hypothetical protein